MSQSAAARGSKHARAQADDASSSAPGDSQSSKRARPHPHPPRTHAPTVRDLITDELAPLANQYWAPGAPALREFEPAIIDNVYTQHLAPVNTKAKEREERKNAGEELEEQEARREEEEEEREQAQIETQRAHRLLLLELSAYLEKSVDTHLALQDKLRIETCRERCLMSYCIVVVCCS
jgi:hypothetical protein